MVNASDDKILEIAADLFKTAVLNNKLYALKCSDMEDKQLMTKISSDIAFMASTLSHRLLAESTGQGGASGA